jgi:hypothetical protein
MKTETQIVREICEWLEKGGFFFWRSNNVPVMQGTRMRALPKYTPRGLSDIMIVWRGRFIAVECKRPAQPDAREPNGRKVRGGKLTDAQREWAVGLSLAGGEFIEAFSVEDVRRELKNITGLDFD